MSGRLSERFQQLKTATGNSARIKTVNRQNRTESHQQQRGNRINQRRGIATNNNSNVTPSARKIGKKNTVSKNGKVRISNARRSGSNQSAANSRPRRPSRGAGNKRTNKKSNPKQQVTGQDLDKELDSYWFAAGKGPNPDVVSLDREMDEYFQKKAATDGSVSV